MLRDFYNSVLEFINTESLTDEEFALSPPDLDPDYSKETFEFLKSTLISRESVSNTIRKLYYVFFAAGAIEKKDAPKNPVSNIFIGSPL